MARRNKRGCVNAKAKVQQSIPEMDKKKATRHKARTFSKTPGHGLQSIPKAIDNMVLRGDADIVGEREVGKLGPARRTVQA